MAPDLGFGRVQLASRLSHLSSRGSESRLNPRVGTFRFYLFLLSSTRVIVNIRRIHVQSSTKKLPTLNVPIEYNII